MKHFLKLDSRIKYVFIPKGENRKECEEIFEILNDKVMKPLSENGMFNEIVYDLTHIYRTTSIFTKMQLIILKYFIIILN